MTQTEREIQQIKQTIATLMERVDTTRNEIAAVKPLTDKFESTLDKVRDSVAALQTRVEVVAAGFDDFKKRWDESDRRRWTVYGVMLAAALTFVANLVLLFLKR